MAKRDPIQRDLAKIKKKIERKLRRYGSLELAAHLIYLERRMPPTPDSENLLRERPYVPFLLGMLLTNNNLRARKPNSNHIENIIKILKKYLDKFTVSLFELASPRKTPEDFMRFGVKVLQLENDLEPGSYPGQKDDYYSKVFAPLDKYFYKKYGFTTERAYCYLNTITEAILENMNQCDPHTTAMADMLTICTDDFCNKHNIKDKNMFKKCLTAFSCSFGTQLDGFTDPLSNNIINFKPIIKLSDNTFFISRAELDRSLDDLLEPLLDGEKQAKSQIWHKFLTLRAEYLEEAVYQRFEKMFPNQVYRNAYFSFNGKEYETDLLVVHNDKILIVESKAVSFPRSMTRISVKGLKDRLGRMVKKAIGQGINAKRYINEENTPVFWKDKSKSEALLKIETLKTDFEFFIIGVTLAHMGGLVITLKDLPQLNIFPNDEYPWMVYLHDLDVIVDQLSAPEFIHYMKQRMRVQEKNIYANSELILLGYYKKHGNLDASKISKDGMVCLAPDYMSMFDEQYAGRQSLITDNR